jgi:hypothetical protein
MIMRRVALIGTLSLLSCLNSLSSTLSTSLRSDFKKSQCSQCVLIKRTNNFGSVFPNRLNRKTFETKLPTQVIFLFYFFFFFFIVVST